MSPFLMVLFKIELILFSNFFPYFLLSFHQWHLGIKRHPVFSLNFWILSFQQECEIHENCFLCICYTFRAVNEWMYKWVNFIGHVLLKSLMNEIANWLKMSEQILARNKNKTISFLIFKHPFTLMFCDFVKTVHLLGKRKKLVKYRLSLSFQVVMAQELYGRYCGKTCLPHHSGPQETLHNKALGMSSQRGDNQPNIV